MHVQKWRIQDFSANSPGGGSQHTILPFFSKNCMKLKEIGPGGASKVLLCTSATAQEINIYSRSSILAMVNSTCERYGEGRHLELLF